MSASEYAKDKGWSREGPSPCPCGVADFFIKDCWLVESFDSRARLYADNKASAVYIGDFGDASIAMEAADALMEDAL